MSFRLVCSSGEASIPKVFLKHLSLFESKPRLAASGSYKLRCKVSWDAVNFFLEKLYDEGADVDPHEITEDKFAELKALSAELGFSKLDRALRLFEDGSYRTAPPPDPEEKLAALRNELVGVCDALKGRVDGYDAVIDQLKQQIKRYEQLFEDIQRQFSAFEKEKTASETELRESISRQIQSLERKLDEAGRVCEERTVEVMRSVDQAINECPKRSDFDTLALEVEHLKGSEAICVRPDEIPTRHEIVPKKSSKEFVCRSKKLDGIIAHLTRECGRNVHDEGIVNVTASSVYNNKQPKNAVERDFGADSGIPEYTSKPEPNSWICYDFKERRVIPTTYSVKSGTTYSPKSWIIEVSNDGYSWTEIDRRDNNYDLNDKFVTANFEISNVPSERFRFFRLRQTGKNHQDNDVLALMSLEIFGNLFVTEKSKEPRPPARKFVYHARNEPPGPPSLWGPPKLDGIIAHLTRECGGNVHDAGVVTVTASSYAENAKNAVDLGSNSYYYSNNEPNQWICYDFKWLRVIPTGYSVMSYSGGPGGSLKSWAVDVSNDGSSWQEIDRRENNDDLVGDRVTVHFAISSVPSEGFHQFRLRQTGKTHRGNGGLVLASLEIFGTLLEQ